MLLRRRPRASFFFFFNDTATTEIYTLSLHDALPISRAHRRPGPKAGDGPCGSHARASRCGSILLQMKIGPSAPCSGLEVRSEEHTSELQSRSDLVCRLLLEKKKNSYP